MRRINSFKKYHNVPPKKRLFFPIMGKMFSVSFYILLKINCFRFWHSFLAYISNNQSKINQVLITN